MSKRSTVHAIVYTALMAAIVYVLTLLYIPLGESRVHFGNAASMLAGLILGPWLGGAASGIGAFFFDLTHGYGIVEALVTFASKFLMAMAAGLVADAYRQEGPVLNSKSQLRAVLGCVVGGLTYIALYMLKTYIKQRFVAGVPLEGTWTVMLAKLPATAINNGFAAVVTPILYTALRPALNAIGVVDRLRPRRS
ncbi:MAG: ECF transporter S component [Oscillospiraceae bacterium]|nr:ECF transporter S component [Oscillospiraceae bacterium]